MKTTKDSLPKSRLDPEKIYFTAKTVDEQSQEGLDREKLMLAHRPKNVSVTFASRSSVVFLGFLLWSLNAEQMLLFGNTIANVSFWFLAGLAIFFGVYSTAKYVIEVCYAYDLSRTPFVITYATIFALLFGAATSGVLGFLSMIAIPLIITAAHWMLVYISTKVIMTVH